MSIYKIRLQELKNLLSDEVIDRKALRELCFNGIPDDSYAYRSLCWKLLLGYLPMQRNKWAETLESKRKLYQQFVIEMVTPPGENGQSECLDHPLSEGPESHWSNYFKDNEVLLQIDKDVRRLCPDISFFQQPTEYPCDIVVNSNNERRLHKRVAPSQLSSANVERKGLGMTKINLVLKRAVQTYEAMNEGSEAHWEVVERILFIYAKLNPGQSYVQGMNEIIGPIYYVFASDPDLKFRQFAEADCFFCFTLLMGEIRDFFIKTLDDSESGIKGMMNKLLTLLKEKDPAVWQRLRDQDLYPQYYSFRWITLLLSQEMALPDVVRVWDSLFSDEGRYGYLIKVCCAMIILLRDQLLDGDFATNVKLLQNFPPIDVKEVLQKACTL